MAQAGVGDPSKLDEALQTGPEILKGLLDAES
jgi:hypothetical protein